MTSIDVDRTTTAWITQALTRRPARGDCTVDGASIAFRRWDGPEARSSRASPDGHDDLGILLVHGGGAHSGWWDHVGPLLAERGPVVALDLSGHGDSEHREYYDMAQWGREVLAVRRFAGLGPEAVVIGHSLGGLVTLSLRERPEAGVGRAVVIDSPIGGPDAQRLPEAGDFSSRHRVYSTPDEAMERFHPVPAQPSLPVVRDHVSADSIRQVQGGWTWKFDARIFDGATRMITTEPGPGGRWAFLRGEDGMVPPEVREVVVRAGGICVDLPGAGHAPMLDQPGALIGALRTVLASWE